VRAKSSLSLAAFDSTPVITKLVVANPTVATRTRSTGVRSEQRQRYARSRLSGSKDASSVERGCERASEGILPLIDPPPRARLHQLLADFGARVRLLIGKHGLAKYGIDGADIEQEVRIRLWRALERETHVTINQSYIQRVVLSTVIDAIRASNSRPTEPLPDENAEDACLVESASGPEQAAVENQHEGLLAGCMEELPTRRRAAVQLHLQGFTAAEIVKRIGTSGEAARKMTQRGLTILRKRLSDAGIRAIDG